MFPLSGRRTGEKKKVKVIVTTVKVGAWNKRTLLDRKKAKRPERRTALIARELKRYNIPIVALSETRFADEGDLTEREAGYTFSGRGGRQRKRGNLVLDSPSCHPLLASLTNHQRASTIA